MYSWFTWREGEDFAVCYFLTGCPNPTTEVAQIKLKIGSKKYLKEHFLSVKFAQLPKPLF